MTRLRIGHTWITHSYLLIKEDQPFCHACDNPFTVKHILIECSDFTHIRNKYYTTTDVHTLFRKVDSSKITEFLSSRQTGIVDKQEFLIYIYIYIYIYIHLLTLYKLTPIGRIYYNFYQFLNKNTDGPVNN